jgi:DNA modification methylase
MAGTEGDLFTVHHDDARRIEHYLRSIAVQLNPQNPDAPVLTASITSPPYGALINYGPDGQIGYGQSDNAYLDACRAVFETLHRRTREDGSMWLIADTYVNRKSSPKNSLLSSELRPLPFQLAELATGTGWTLREVIIWHKDRTRPWSHHGRLRNAFEYVLLFVKTSKFKFHTSRLRDASQMAHWWVRYPERYNPHGKVPDNVWHIPLPPQGSWPGAAVEHACPFPPDLVHRLLLLSTDPEDIVCDPFAGSGTVIAVAEAMGRRAVGTELNQKFVEAYKNRVRPDILNKLRADDKYQEGGGPSPRTVINLRAVKFPKAILASARSRFPSLPTPRAIIVAVDKINPDSKLNVYANVTSTFIFDNLAIDDQEEAARILKEIAGRPPFTKYGVCGDITAMNLVDALTLFKGRKFYLYEHGNTWMAVRRVTMEELTATPTSKKRGRYMPIGSNVQLRIQMDHVGDPSSDTSHLR